MEMAAPLIRTKLSLPFLRLELVARPRLQEKVARGLLGPLTLVTAPAGFGKTTLVAACLKNCGIPVAWVSLDNDDNQIWRFLRYLVTALHEVAPSIGCDASQLLKAGQAAPETVLTSLINDLEAGGKELVLALDDYHFIIDPAVNAALAFLLDHCPCSLHLLIASRVDPPLPVARLRARGQTVELRAADLCFTEDEASLFLNEIMGLHLDTPMVAVLEERTEGWIAGLQMAALSMRDRQDVIAFIDGFSGTNRYILDYLLEEVLANQTPEIQDFLLYTSVLDRLTASMCDAVLQMDGDNNTAAEELASYPAAPGSCASAILDYLEKANLFLIPLDDERIWYRYHHLFADLLFVRMQQNHPQEIPLVLRTGCGLVRGPASLAPGNCLCHPSQEFRPGGRLFSPGRFR